MKTLKYILLMAMILLSSQEAHSRALVADAFPRKINIDHDFQGINVLIYGARNDAGKVVIVARGPKNDYTLRKKGRVAGIWTNVKNEEIKNLNSFYSIASTRPIETIHNNSLLRQLEIGGDNIKISSIEELPLDEIQNLKKESLNILGTQDLFEQNEKGVSFWGETLFRAFIKFPKNIVKGIYHIDVYLFSDGLLKSFQTMPVIVEKVGFEAFMYDLAHKNSLLYGILCVFVALILGWFVSIIFPRS